jgi:hypothetical protein
LLTVKGRVALEKVVLREKNAAPLASLDVLEILVGKADVTGQSFAIDKVRLAGLDVHVRRQINGALNLEKLAPASPPAPKTAHTPAHAPAQKKPASSAGEPRFAVREFALEPATIHLRDETVHPAMEVAVDHLAVTVRGLSNAPGSKASVIAGLRATPGGTASSPPASRPTTAS